MGPANVADLAGQAQQGHHGHQTQHGLHEPHEHRADLAGPADAANLAEGKRPVAKLLRFAAASPSPWPLGDLHAAPSPERPLQAYILTPAARDARREARNDPYARDGDADAEPEPSTQVAAASPNEPIHDSAPPPVDEEDRRSAILFAPTGTSSVGWLAAGGGLLAAAALGAAGGGGAGTGGGAFVGVGAGVGAGAGTGGIGGDVGSGGPGGTGITGGNTGGNTGGIVGGGGGSSAGGVDGHSPNPDPMGQPVSLGLAKAAGVVQGLPSTNDPVIQVGNLEADGAWYYRVDGQAWVQGQGTSVTGLALTGQGQHTVEVFQMDLAGNRSGVAALNFWLDTVAPDAPTLQFKNNTGDPNDSVTRDATLTVTGVQPGDEWFFSVDGGEFQAGQGQELSDAQIGGDGPHTVRVFVRDATGNQSPEATLTLERDTTAPVTAPVVSLAQDTGLPGDLLTLKPWLTLSGLEPGARWSLSLDGGQTWTAPASAADPVFRDDAAFSRDGHWTVLARQVDAAGNVGTAITTFNFDLDRQGPEAPSVRLKNDSGLSASDHVTNDGTILVQVAEAGLTVVYRMDDDAVWTNLADSELVPDGWADGSHVIEFRAFDAAGNRSDTVRLEFVLDTQAPSLPNLHLGQGLGWMNAAMPAGV